jgi:hypothetical protein
MRVPAVCGAVRWRSASVLRCWLLIMPLTAPRRRCVRPSMTGRRRECGQRAGRAVPIPLPFDHVSHSGTPSVKPLMACGNSGERASSRNPVLCADTHHSCRPWIGADSCVIVLRKATRGQGAPGSGMAKVFQVVTPEVSLGSTLTERTELQTRHDPSCMCADIAS